MRIDTKAIRLRWKGVQLPLHRHEAIALLKDVFECCDELDATTPFASRAEVETYLKGKGEWTRHDDYFRWSTADSERTLQLNGGDAILGSRVNETGIIAWLPYRLLTPALLDKILEAK